MNLKELTQEVCLLCREAGVFVQQQSTLIKAEQIEHKGLHDMVSYVDRMAEQLLMEKLTSLLPESGFIAEESGESKAAVYNWIIDPIDGTTNFIHHIPVYSISIALQRNNDLILGVVYEINSDSCFYSCEGSAVFLNGKPIAVSAQTDLENSLIATGFPYRDFSLLKPYLALFADLMQHTRGIRRLGSAAVDLAFVACGRYDAYFEYALHPWDVAAGTFLVRQAGGVVTTFSSDTNPVYGRSILAANPKIHEKMCEKISLYFEGEDC